MRENAAVHGGADNRRAGWTSLVTMGLVAVIVLVLALVVSGTLSSRSHGTIVVQRFTERFIGSARQTHSPKEVSITTVSETSRSGRLGRLLITESLSRGYELVIDGPSLERYVPTDTTVYEMTASQLQAAEERILHVHFRRGRSLAITYAGTSLAPGRSGFFWSLLRRHIYRLAGRTTFDGRQALKLVPPSRDGILSFTARSGVQQVLGTAYIAPGSHDPLGAVTPGFAVIRWTEYAVLDDTPANRNLLSLTARHPGARVSSSASAYLREILRHGKH